MIKLKRYLKPDISIGIKEEIEYKECIADLIENEAVQSMKRFIQHSDLSCFEHCINVSYNSYLICRHLGLDYYAAARGGLLHDLFLYDWHITKHKNGLHAFSHPYAALKNANNYFELNDKEKDIIQKHMWPLTLKLPKYKESFIVSFVDKYCAFAEVVRTNNREHLYRIEEFVSKY
ncbi:MAG: HD family phosphohydrolase [Clostridium sp.]|nr:HD family phosphohydrolase [Clostridium sp.]